MADISRGNFFERYGPSNYEADQFQLQLKLSIHGDQKPHRLFSNGKVRVNGTSEWVIDFPRYFNGSSLYVHLTQSPLEIRETSYTGLTHTIPIVIYSKTAELADQALSKILPLFQELESTYGPYLHPSFTAYIYGKGGMEYAGATISGVGALGHELTHSWFARGVMPSDGRSGWIDEGIASWRDYGYLRGDTTLSRPGTNLAKYSIYSIFTPPNVYVDGRALMGDLDAMFATSHSGLRPVLKAFFAQWKSQVISTEIFQEFLQTSTGISLAEVFKRYVYGEPRTGEPGPSPDRGLHPSPLTEEQILEIR
jgi:hypothetical protein